MSSTSRGLARGASLFLVGCLTLGTADVALAGRQVVGVRVDLQKLPRHFVSNREIMSRVGNQLEKLAADRLERPFPLFDWRPYHELAGEAPVTPPAAVVTLSLSKPQKTSRRIAVKAAFEIAKKPSESGDLEIAEQEVLGDAETWPALGDLEDKLSDRGGKALERLTEAGAHDEWRRFIAKILLADQIHESEAVAEVLVLPVSADELRADDKSEIVAEVVSVDDARREIISSITLRPDGPVRSGAQRGWLECSVKEFHSKGQTWMAWVAQIKEVVVRKKVVEVRALKYVKRETPYVAWEP